MKTFKNNVVLCLAAPTTNAVRYLAAPPLAAVSAANTDVTVDFKVTGSNYVNDVATVSGTVNHGAIQSKKAIVVDVTYDYSFVADKIEVIPGETTTVTVFVPGNRITGITEPTIEKGRLNPKGKITGYNWENKLSIMPTADLVDLSLVPSGHTLVPGSVTIISVCFEAYLEDPSGVKIADTLLSGILYPHHT